MNRWPRKTNAYKQRSARTQTFRLNGPILEPHAALRPNRFITTSGLMMFIKRFILLTVMLTALSMGAAVGHFLELPAKMTYDGPMWLSVQQTLYGPGFGTFGAGFEVGALVATAVLAIVLRHQSQMFGWVLLAAICMAATHAAFWMWLAPANATIAALKPDALPADWMALRNLWEYTHAGRAVLQIVAFGALVCSILAVGSVGVAKKQAV